MREVYLECLQQITAPRATSTIREMSNLESENYSNFQSKLKYKKKKKNCNFVQKLVLIRIPNEQIKHGPKLE